MDNKDIKILEAILFASGEPLDENDLKEKIKDKMGEVASSMGIPPGLL